MSLTSGSQHCLGCLSFALQPISLVPPKLFGQLVLIPISAVFFLLLPAGSSHHP